MLDNAVPYSFCSPCVFTATVVQEDVEYSGHNDAEGRHVFTGALEYHARRFVVRSERLPRLGRRRVRDYCPIRRPVWAMTACAYRVIKATFWQSNRLFLPDGFAGAPSSPAGALATGLR